jgi:hypothetical protein
MAGHLSVVFLIVPFRRISDWSFCFLISIWRLMCSTQEQNVSSHPARGRIQSGAGMIPPPHTCNMGMTFWVAKREPDVMNSLQRNRNIVTRMRGRVCNAHVLLTVVAFDIDLQILLLRTAVVILLYCHKNRENRRRRG